MQYKTSKIKCSPSSRLWTDHSFQSLPSNVKLTLKRWILVQNVDHLTRNFAQNTPPSHRFCSTAPTLLPGIGPDQSATIRAAAMRGLNGSVFDALDEFIATAMM
jgi:hypothetical protein